MFRRRMAGQSGSCSSDCVAATPDDWRAELVAAFDEEALLSKAEGWPENELEALGHLAAGIRGIQRYDLGLSMLERAEPLLRRRLANAPLASFEEVKHIFWGSSCGSGTGLGSGWACFSHRPAPRRSAAACGGTSTPPCLAGASRRARRGTRYADLRRPPAQKVRWPRVAPRLRKMSRRSLVDIERLEPLFERHWQELPPRHDGSSLDAEEAALITKPAATWVRRHAHSIRTMATRLAAPAAIGRLSRWSPGEARSHSTRP